MDGVGTAGSLINASWKIAQVVYELKAVGEQTRDLLDTTSQLSGTLQHARVLRRRRSALLDSTEKKWIDDVLITTDKAVGNVAALIEPARVDMQTQCNKIKFWTRGSFVLKESPKVQVQLSRLGIAAQGLNTAMSVLCTRDGSVNSGQNMNGLNTLRGHESPNVGSPGSEGERGPPSYQAATELLDKRQHIVLKRQTSQVPMKPEPYFDNSMPLQEEPNALSNVDVAETQPTPENTPDPSLQPYSDPSPQPDAYAESDGLQVVESNYLWTRNSQPGVAPVMDPHMSDPIPVEFEPNPPVQTIVTPPLPMQSPTSYQTLPSQSPSPGRTFLPYRPGAPQPPPGPPPAHAYQKPPSQPYTNPSSPAPQVRHYSASSTLQHLYNARHPTPEPTSRPPSYPTSPQPQQTQMDSQPPYPHQSLPQSQQQLSPQLQPRLSPQPQQQQYPPQQHIPSSIHPQRPQSLQNQSQSYSTMTSYPTRPASTSISSTSINSPASTASWAPTPITPSLNLTVNAPLDPYARPVSRGSIMTTEELSLGGALGSGGGPRQRGKARGRAWLEHQASQ